MHMRYMKKQNYTLVEILVVIAIVGILLGISIPAFDKITKGNRVHNAAASIGSAVSLARSQAVSNRRYVAMILPLDTADGKPELQQYLYKSFRLCYLTFNGTDYTFENWLPGSKWISLPDGTVISEVDATDTAGTIGINSANYNKLLEIKALKPVTATYPSLTYCAIVFNPFGGTVNDTLYVKVTEGIFTGNVLTKKILTSKDATDKPLNYFAVKINKFTGKASYE